MARRDQHRIRPLGTAVCIGAVLLFLGLLAMRTSTSLLEARVVVKADFRMVTGLREGSPVQLAGVQVGYVKSIDFVKVQYECDPLTEDVGRYGDGRTNDCDEFLFCSPQRRCADFEAWAGKGHHPHCGSSAACDEEAVCMTSGLRRGSRRVRWEGPLGVCARYRTEHWRIRVAVNIPEYTLPLIRTDSRATVAANSILGDQLVSISPGHGDPLPEDRRIQTNSSIHEDIERFRGRLHSITANADDALGAIVNVIKELKDERTINALKGTLENLDVITRRVAHGEGLIGALLNSRGYRRDFGTTIGALRSTSEGLEHAVGTSNNILDTADRNIEPLIDDTRAVLVSVDDLLVSLENPRNKSLGAKLLRDPDGKLARHVEGIASNTASLTGSTSAIVAAVDHGDGTLGKLIGDPRVLEDVGKLLSSLASHDIIRGFALWYLDRKGAIHRAGSRDSNRPPRP